MTDKISDERIDEMLAGLEGVTLGPWFVGIADGDNGTAGLAQIDNGADMWPVIAEWPEAEHVARCDPETIRALLLELRAYRAAANPLQAVVDRFPAPAPVSEITEEMVERMYAEMDRRMYLPKHIHQERNPEWLPVDDTQVGIEFAVEFLTAAMGGK